ncbi:hypothetical protein GF343_04965 [Candidatus Woesearchaeota archaeon]|nr:hypothetical protein [Candidatus Woesearchaeota archaeon]
MSKKTTERKNPKLWEKAKKKTGCGQGKRHSARACQLAVKLYKKMGGKYEGKKTKELGLVKWTEEDWGYVGKKKKSRYLPKKVRKKLTRGEKAATSRAKNVGTKKGKKYVSYSDKIKKLVRKATTKKKKSKKKAKKKKK